jgi:hypothetical protein
MIAARGGPELLGLQGVLKRLYFTYELLFSTVLKNEAPPCSRGTPEFFFTAALPFSSRYGVFTLSESYIDPTSYGFSSNTVTFLSALCHQLSSSDVFVNPSEDDSNSIIHDEHFAELLSELDGQTHSQSIQTQGEDHVLKSLILAASIQFPHLSPPSTWIPIPLKIRQLEYHLSQTSVQSFWPPIPGALLWCLVAGANASKAMAERNWFIANIIRLTTGLAFQNWEGVRNTLETFAKCTASINAVDEERT